MDYTSQIDAAKNAVRATEAVHAALNRMPLEQGEKATAAHWSAIQKAWQAVIAARGSLVALNDIKAAQDKAALLDSPIGFMFSKD